MIEFEHAPMDDYEATPKPYQRVAYRVNNVFGGELSDDTPLSWVTNYFIPDKMLDSLVVRKYNRLWARVFSISTPREKSMITRAFNALARLPLETVRAVRDIPQAQAFMYEGLGDTGLAVSKACLEQKPQTQVS